MGKTKKCSKCKIIKPLGEYWKNSQSKDGHRPDCRTCCIKRKREIRTPCRICGETARYKNGQCKACAKEHGRRYRKKYPEKHRERKSRWRAENHDKWLEQERRWRANNKEKAKEKHHRWLKNNRDKAREASNHWKENNKEKVAEYGRQWRKNNPQRRVEQQNLRRARKAKSSGNHTATEFETLCKQYNYHCLACGKKKKLTVDHVIPISKGGSNDISNIQPLCKSCNASKGTKTTDYRTKPGIKHWIQKKLFG